MIDKNGYRLIERSTESIGVVFNAARAPLASWGCNPYLDGKAEQPWLVIIVGNPSTEWWLLLRARRMVAENCW